MSKPDRFVVELDRPASGWSELQQATGRARLEAERMTAEGTPVRFLRSIFVPEDESCFFLYEARDPETVGEAVRRADLGAGPIRTTIPAGPEVLR